MRCLIVLCTVSILAIACAQESELYILIASDCRSELIRVADIKSIDMVDGWEDDPEGPYRLSVRTTTDTREFCWVQRAVRDQEYRRVRDLLPCRGCQRSTLETAMKGGTP
jgi:hypothetical protein